uniref:ATP synthase n=1 Tax=Siphoviridae sp. ctLqe90 TaxID=2825456 RepID=A0A8S5Q2C1_9CAUD|nr:MAG TPA: ATP synthase [Siphoviridae sp. ctLqe90]
MLSISTVKTPQFFPYNSSSNPIPHQKLYTTVQYLHTLSKMYLHMFFSIFFLLQTKISTQTFHSPL